MRRSEDDVNKKLYQTTLNNLRDQGIEVDYDTIESVCKSKWEFIAHIIRFGQMESYRDKYFGNFGVKKWREAYKEMKFMTNEAKEALYVQIPDTLERLKFLEDKHKQYHESKKFDENKLWYPVIMTDRKGTETHFETLGEASRVTGLQPIHIYVACVTKTFTKRKLKFRFNKIDGNQNQERSTSE